MRLAQIQFVIRVFVTFACSIAFGACVQTVHPLDQAGGASEVASVTIGDVSDSRVDKEKSEITIIVETTKDTIARKFSEGNKITLKPGPHTFSLTLRDKEGNLFAKTGTSTVCPPTNQTLKAGANTVSVTACALNTQGSGSAETISTDANLRIEVTIIGGNQQDGGQQGDKTQLNPDEFLKSTLKIAAKFVSDPRAKDIRIAEANAEIGKSTEYNSLLKGIGTLVARDINIRKYWISVPIDRLKIVFLMDFKTTCWDSKKDEPGVIGQENGKDKYLELGDKVAFEGKSPKIINLKSAPEVDAAITICTTEMKQAQ